VHVAAIAAKVFEVRWLAFFLIFLLSFFSGSVRVLAMVYIYILNKLYVKRKKASTEVESRILFTALSRRRGLPHNVNRYGTWYVLLLTKYSGGILIVASLQLNFFFSSTATTSSSYHTNKI
jgi:hypothetical protein